MPDGSEYFRRDPVPAQFTPRDDQPQLTTYEIIAGILQRLTWRRLM